jgi:SsrA-binding protein
MNFHIGKYSAAGVLSPDEQKRPRLLFIHKKDILYLRTGAEPGTMIVPTEIYFRGNLIKLKISLARARKKYEKKQVIKERDEKKILRKELSVRG